MWIFELSLGVCSMELCSLVSSLEYLVSNERQVLLGDIRLGGSATHTVRVRHIRGQGLKTYLFNKSDNACAMVRVEEV